VTAARISRELVEQDAGQQPEGRGPRAAASAITGARRVSWHADNIRRWHSWHVHLLPAERSGHRVIDGERVCQAIAALGPATDIQARAKTFAILGDPTRLTLLTCIRAAGPISVSDLAAATGLNDTTVSQTLRYLRAAEVVTAERDGRVIRYQLADGPVAALLAW
jgi:ArsR family transcriptional regulator, lead/cadmium/zinc/bismuth-responsive transcriptional repressor